ncbi:hypothetical protein ACF0H5_020978 [Mactra antiquata]
MEVECYYDFSTNDTISRDELHFLYLVDAFQYYCVNISYGCNGSGSTFVGVRDNNPYVSRPFGVEQACCAPCICNQNEVYLFDMEDALFHYCPQMELPSTEFRKRQMPRERCHSTYVKNGMTDSTYALEENGVIMIDRCDQRWIDMADDAHDVAQNTVIGKCQNWRQFSDIHVQTPVSTVTGNAVFKNRYCAECNFVQQIEPWTPTIACLQGLFNMIDFDDVITTIETSADCYMVFNPPPGYSHISCYDVIGECNVTGQWEFYDPYIEEACAFYIIPFQYNYRNVFCFICNSKSSANVPSCYFSQTIFVNFELILRLDIYQNDVVENKNKDEKCFKNEMYDPFQQSCLPVSCWSYKVLRKGKCVYAIDKISGLCYEAFIKMTPTSPVSLTDNEIDRIVLQTVVPLLLGGKDKLFTSVRRRQTADVNNVDDLIDGVVYILSHVVICFNHVEGPSPVDRLDSISKLHGTTVKTNAGTIFVIELDVFSYSTTVANYSDDVRATSLTNVTYTDYNDNTSFHWSFENFPCYEWSHKCTDNLKESVTETLLPLHSCPNVALNTSFYSVEHYHWGIFIKALGVSLKWNEFKFLPMPRNSSDVSVIICKDRIAQAFSNISLSNENPWRVQFPFAIDGVLSLSCTSISIACGLLTVICCSCLKDMQTQPCINNLSLALSLVFAQSLFQFGSGQAKHVEKWICQVLGILTHYFWLVTILWMNVCSYHMYKVFRKEYTAPTSPTERKKVTFFYWTYCLTFAAPPVIVNIIIESIRSNQQYIGYGDLMCYISNNEMIGYVFIGPVAIVIGCNICLFAVTVFHIGTSKSNNFFEQDRRLVTIYVKLSTLTGVTWIFGLLSLIFPGVDALGYLFIILNAGQGLFIFVFFICSKRVLNCLKTTVTSTLSRVFNTESV